MVGAPPCGNLVGREPEALVEEIPANGDGQRLARRALPRRPACNSLCSLDDLRLFRQNRGGKAHDPFLVDAGSSRNVRNASPSPQTRLDLLGAEPTLGLPPSQAAAPPALSMTRGPVVWIVALEQILALESEGLTDDVHEVVVEIDHVSARFGAPAGAEDEPVELSGEPDEVELLHSLPPGPRARM